MVPQEKFLDLQMAFRRALEILTPEELRPELASPLFHPNWYKCFRRAIGTRIIFKPAPCGTICACIKEIYSNSFINNNSCIVKKSNFLKQVP